MSVRWPLTSIACGQWAAPQPGLLLWKFPSAHDEIKDASKLLVGPGQGALLVYEGAVANVLDAEEICNLKTDNQPFINTLLKLRTGFESEHKLKLYFYRRADNVNQPWGTPTRTGSDLDYVHGPLPAAVQRWPGTARLPAQADGIKPPRLLRARPAGLQRLDNALNGSIHRGLAVDGIFLQKGGESVAFKHEFLVSNPALHPSR